jgi:hypothetical protein
MAVQIEGGASNFTGSGTSLSTIIEVGAYANRLLWIVCVAGDATTINTPTVNGSATGVTLADGITSDVQINAYYLVAPPSGIYSVAFTTTTPQALAITVQSCYGVNQASPIGTVAVNAISAGTSINVAPLPGSIGDLAIDFVGWEGVSGPTSGSPSGGQTSITGGSAIVSLGASYLLYSATQPTMDWMFADSVNASMVATTMHAEQDQTPDRTMPCIHIHSWS